MKKVTKTANKVAFNKGSSASNKPMSVDQLVLNGVLSVLQGRDSWNGTMTDLGKKLSKVWKKESDMLPKTPSYLRIVLNRVVRKLKSQKVSVSFDRSSDSSRTRFVTFSK